MLSALIQTINLTLVSIDSSSGFPSSLSHLQSPTNFSFSGQTISP